MSKKKGLSVAEKKTKLLEIFHETKEVYQLKDLEKIAPKSKGIVQNSVKSVLQDLVDDGLVETAKIGSMVYFWSFPGKAIKYLKRKLADAEKQSHNLDDKSSLAQKRLEEKQCSEVDLEKIEKLQSELEILKKRTVELEKEVSTAKELDPSNASKKAEDSKKIFEAANRWTDNVFSVKYWCKNKFGMEDKDLNKSFEIPEDFDYLEDKT